MPGAVAAGDRHTAGAGAVLLRLGGNAVDAAVGATLAAFVAEPPLTGPFGGGFAMVGGPHIESRAYDFFADVPGRPAADVPENKDMDFVGIDVDFGSATQIFHIGRASVATPLLLLGLLELQKKYGRLPLPQVVGPARELAHHGVPISEQVAPIMQILAPILTHTEESRRLFAPHGRLLRAGELFINADLAQLFSRLGEGDTDGARSALLRGFGPPLGLLTAADLETRHVDSYAPITTRVGDFDVRLNPPPSSGGLLVAFGLRLFETVKADELRSDADTYTRLFAAMVVCSEARRAVLDAAIVAGGDALASLAKTFLSDAFVDGYRERFEHITRDGLTNPGTGVEPNLGSTTHISCIDAAGMACSITSSNGEGCGHVVAGTGVMANNFMGEEDLHPGGFHSRPPGSRLTSMMCPTLVCQNDAPVLALGTGGSNRIRSALLQILVHHLLRKAPLDVAVSLPRLHFEGGVLCAEQRGPDHHHLSDAVLTALGKRIDDVRVFPDPNMYFGGVHAAQVNGGGVGDLRRGGAVVVA